MKNNLGQEQLGREEEAVLRTWDRRGSEVNSSLNEVQVGRQGWAGQEWELGRLVGSKMAQQDWQVCYKVGRTSGIGVSKES